MAQKKSTIRLSQLKIEETGLNLQIEIQKKQLADKIAMLERLKIKAPTFSNVPAMAEVFKGNEYGSVPAIIASYDPCLSCTAR